MSPFNVINAIAIALKMARRSDRPLFIHLIYVFEASQILLWLKQSKAEHVHAHFGTNSTEVAMLVHALGGPCFSFTVHGPEEFDKPYSIGLPEKIRRAAFVIAISSFCRSQLFRFADHEEWKKIAVVHCGLESRDFLQDPEPSTSRRIICVGRLCEQKGQLLLVEAARRLADRGELFQLTLAGDGELRPTIEKLVQEYNLEAHIRVAGWMSNKEIREELLNARALVLPSFAEGLPVSIMEAMALTRPVISTYVAGIPELVGTAGWLVPAGDVEELTRAIEECLNASPRVLKVLGEKCFATVSLRHNVEKEAAKLASLFANSLG